MKTKRLLMILLIAIVVPGGMLLLLPFASRVFGGIVSGLRAEMVAVGLMLWIVLQDMDDERLSNAARAGHSIA